MRAIKNHKLNFFNKIDNPTLFNFCLFILFIIFLVFRFSIILSYSSNIVIGEDNNVWNIQKMLFGDQLYTNPEDYPFEIFQYTPLSQFFTFFTAKILSFKVGENVHGIFVIGRIYSLIFNLLTSFVIYRFCFVFLKISKNVNLLLTFISLIIITYIDFTLRADSLTNFCIIFSMFWFFKTLDSKRIVYFVLCVTFSLCAIFSKQSAVQVLVYFSVIYLFFKPKKIISFYLILIFFSFLFCVFFYLIYGKIFFYSIIVGISNPIDINLGITLLFDYTKRFGILLLISVFSLFISNEKSKSSNLYIKILLFFFASSFIFAFGTSNKIGAGLNYYTFNIYISIILTSVFLDKLLNSDLVRYKHFLLVLILFITTGHILSERMYNRHLPQISLNHKIDYCTDIQFVKEVKNRIGILRNQDYLFTPNKNIKNLYFYNTILPNTEYYAPESSKFNWSKFDESKLKYIIINEYDSNDLNTRTFNQFNIKITDYILLYKFKNRKLYCLKKSY